MSKHLRAFLAGLLLVIPFAVTFWVIWRLIAFLGAIGFGVVDLAVKTVTQKNISQLFGHSSPIGDAAPAWVKLAVALIGSGIVLGIIYLLGLLINTLLLKRFVGGMEMLIHRMPGVKTIYQSIRDLLKLFGSGAGKMGKVVLYNPNGGEMAMLGVLTNPNPAGLSGIENHQMVAVYLPLAYMLGGPIVYVPRKHLRELDMPVEQALKICATAEISQAMPQAATLTMVTAPKHARKRVQK